MVRVRQTSLQRQDVERDSRNEIDVGHQFQVHSLAAIVAHVSIVHCRSAAIDIGIVKHVPGQEELELLREPGLGNQSVGQLDLPSAVLVRAREGKHSVLHLGCVCDLASDQ